MHGIGNVMTHIRTRSRFALLRSVVTALRGVRGRKSGSGMKDLSNVNFDSVPEGELYESYFSLGFFSSFQ